MEKQSLKRMIDIAAGRVPADLCLRCCRVVDVFNQTVFEADVLIAEGRIAGFGAAGFPPAAETYDAAGRYLAPGFIDSHVHIESSHLSPAEFSRMVVPHGTTTVVADPHEICNVCGLEGFDYMLKASEDIALQVFLQLPSCVPCTPFEHAGATLNAPELAQRMGCQRVLGLGELMNFVGVCNADEAILDKLLVAARAQKLVDGHSPGLGGTLLDAYAASGVRTDHECTSPEELRDRIRRGMYVLLRQGSACHDVRKLLPGVDKGNERFCLFCTDDRQSADLIREGHIDNNLRVAVEAGLDPISAICMATINTATCYGLQDRGAVVPGRRADLVLLEDLQNPQVQEVWIGGRHVASGGCYLAQDPHVAPEQVSGRMNVQNFSAERLALSLTGSRVRTIRILPGSIVTECGSAEVETDAAGCWRRDEQDIVKIAVVERHNGTGNLGLGLLEGYGLRNGAIATSVAHDSHNIIVAGDNDRDMALAVEELIRLGGGMAIAQNGVVLDRLAHEIAGLMTDRPGEEVARRLQELGERAHELLGVHETIDPFMTLCFMALPVIPALKITDLGLFDVNAFHSVPVNI
ncbi:MAG: adenine deaminase [Oscillospiraceae bacterium]|nr:adenine deaminase [Oscillospiraceae bacterium]